MKKYILPLILIILLSLALSACNTLGSIPLESKSRDTETSETPDPTSEEESPAETSAEEPSADESAAEPADDKAASEGEDFVGKLEEVEGEKGPKLMAADFSLQDQNGTRHKLKDYEGKILILNFWQTWCPPCRMEMPDFQSVYEKYGENQEDVVILGIASPKNELQSVYSQEQLNDEQIKEFLKKDNYSYPSLMDYKGELYSTYQISAFPTTFFVGKDGAILGRIPGAVNEETLVSLIDGFLQDDAD